MAVLILSPRRERRILRNIDACAFAEFVLDAKGHARVVTSWTLEERFGILKRIRGVDPIGDDLSIPCQYK